MHEGIRHSNLAVAIALLVTAATACGSNSSQGAAENVVERQALLASVTDNVILPAYAEFSVAANAMATAAEAYAQAVDSESARQAVDEAFLRAYRAMQYAEMLQVGPYGASDRFAGGLNIRDRVYSWPVTSPCLVDQEIVERDYAKADFFDKALPRAFGFDALEYLLYPESTNRCDAPIWINQEGAWDALSAEEITQRRADYAAVLARRIAEETAALNSAWTNGFAEEFRNAGTTSGTYRTAQAGVEALFASIFYVELNVKDAKLAGPLGISPDCTAATCPELLESRFANESLSAVDTNLRAFRDVVYGGPGSDGYGFGDLLRSSGADTIADDLEAGVDEALSRLPLITDPMAEALVTDTAPPIALHGAVRELTTLLKTQFVSALALRVPNEGAADND